MFAFCLLLRENQSMGGWGAAGVWGRSSRESWELHACTSQKPARISSSHHQSLQENRTWAARLFHNLRLWSPSSTTAFFQTKSSPTHSVPLKPPLCLPQPRHPPGTCRPRLPGGLHGSRRHLSVGQVTSATATTSAKGLRVSLLIRALGEPVFRLARPDAAF